MLSASTRASAPGFVALGGFVRDVSINKKEEKKRSAARQLRVFADRNPDNPATPPDTGEPN